MNDLLRPAYPAQSLSDLLPELLQPRRGEFADRYLSIFQTLLDELDEKIAHSGALYDVDSAPDSQLVALCQWLGVEDIALWRPDRLRRLAGEAISLHRLRGTLEGLRRVLSLFCGAQVCLVETWHTLRFPAQARALTPLYGRDRRSLWVLLFGSITEEEERAAAQLIAHALPVGVTHQLRLAEHRLVLGGYTYLGINSVLAGVTAAQLNRRCALGSTAIEGGSTCSLN